MKKYIFLTLLILTVLPIRAINLHERSSYTPIERWLDESRFAFRAKTYTAYIIPISIFKDHNYNVALGGEVSFELLPVTSRYWTNQWHYPVVGLSILGMDLASGDKNEIGQLFAVYPYLGWSLGKIDVSYDTNIEFNARVGFGFAFYNKLSAITGSSNSGIIATGLNAQLNLPKGASWFVELGTNSINNLELQQPSSTMNLAYASLGYRYHYGYNTYRKLQKVRTKELPYRWMLNSSVMCGYKDVNFVDNTFAKLLSININALGKINNLWATGLGIDVFYNNGFVQQGSNGLVEYNSLISSSDYFIEETKFANQIRIGVSWDNLINMGNVLGIIADCGMYIYDPIRNFYSSDITGGVAKKLPFGYKYNPAKEDGWVYFRAGIRVRIIENLHLQMTAKTHLYRFEHLAFGLSYALPTYDSKFIGSSIRGNKWKMNYLR